MSEVYRVACLPCNDANGAGIRYNYRNGTVPGGGGCHTCTDSSEQEGNDGNERKCSGR